MLRMSANITTDHTNTLATDSNSTDTIVTVAEEKKSTFRIDPHISTTNRVIPILNDKVECMAFDCYNNNMYKTYAKHKKIEIQSVITGEKFEFPFMDKPYNIVVIPAEGILFIIFQANFDSPNDKPENEGGSKIHLAEHNLCSKKISVTYDKENKRVFWTDEDKANIQSIDIQGDSRFLFRLELGTPLNLVILDDEIFWAARKMLHFNWEDKQDASPRCKGFHIEIEVRSNVLHLTTNPGSSTGSSRQSSRRNSSRRSSQNSCLAGGSSEGSGVYSSEHAVRGEEKSRKSRASNSDVSSTRSKKIKRFRHIHRSNKVGDYPDDEDAKETSSEAPANQPNAMREINEGTGMPEFRTNTPYRYANEMEEEYHDQARTSVPLCMIAVLVVITILIAVICGVIQYQYWIFQQLKEPR